MEVELNDSKELDFKGKKKTKERRLQERKENQNRLKMASTINRSKI